MVRQEDFEFWVSHNYGVSAKQSDLIHLEKNKKKIRWDLFSPLLGENTKCETIH